MDSFLNRATLYALYKGSIELLEEDDEDADDLDMIAEAKSKETNATQKSQETWNREMQNANIHSSPQHDSKAMENFPLRN